MGYKWGTTVTVAAVSLFFQNCENSFQQIDPEQKLELLKSTSVFKGNAVRIYIYKPRTLHAVEDGPLKKNDEGSIPVIGPDGESVIVIGQPTEMAGVIPASSAGNGDVDIVDGVVRGGNYYLPVQTTTVTTTTGTTGNNNNSNNEAALIANAFGAFMGAIGAMSNSSGTGTGSSGSTDTAEAYQAFTESGNYPAYNSGGNPNYPKIADNDLAGKEWGIPQCRDLNNINSDPDFTSGKCHSPLLIAFDSDLAEFKTFELTNPVTQGVMFDIVGKRAKPAAHTKKKISWHKNTNYMFIVLPNAAGEVNGIDELFGNNTAGPDGKFAKNGYEALRKWDSNNDGFITADDQAFTKLRLWSDKNYDAKASKDELLTFDEMKLTTVDLRYDSSYIEADAFGNFTTLKSVVKTSDGKLHLLFDLWFREADSKNTP